MQSRSAEQGIRLIETHKTISNDEVSGWIDQLETRLSEHLGPELQDCAMIGIRTGGVTIAEILHKKLAFQLPLGQLNISFYRDDFSHIGMHPVVGASEIPLDLEDKTVILVDDVLNSGRTIRAAMNEIFDYGRPARVILAVMVDRKGRELPIQADVRGITLELEDDQHIKLDCDQLTCEITTA